MTERLAGHEAEAMVGNGERFEPRTVREWEAELSGFGSLFADHERVEGDDDGHRVWAKMHEARLALAEKISALVYEVERLRAGTEPSSPAEPAEGLIDANVQELADRLVEWLRTAEPRGYREERADVLAILRRHPLTMWKPIETHAEGSKNVLLWDATRPPGVVVIGFRDEGDVFRMSQGHLRISATHWMPLPAAPGEQRPAEGRE